jgi:hypothetical protein
MTMDASDEELAKQFKSMLMGGERATAFGDEPAEQDAEDTGADFFSAMSAYRAARRSGDARQMAEAEEMLREVVRGELSGEPCQ